MRNILIIMMSLITFNSFAHDNFIDHAWQTIPSGVRISLRNKLMDKPYLVTFTVTNTNTLESVSINKKSEANDWNQLVFPDDFKECKNIHHLCKNEPNQFVWNAFVEGRLVLSGKFTYPHDEIIWTKHD